MSRILVTGATGFLGSFLCDRLLADGHEVIGMDSNVSGRTENLEEAFYNANFAFYDHDVTEFIHVSGELDAVLHLASLASPVFYRDYPIKTLKVGALGTHKTLGLAKAKDATYLFTSTSEVYDDPEVHPQPESYCGSVDPYGPRSCYDESKRYGEALVRGYRDEHDLDVRVARIFNTYGPWMRLDDGRVIPNFMSQALTGEELTVYGDGEQTRSFCYVSDLIDGLVALLESYPEWTVLILDEIDHIRHDSNYDPNDFFYRLLRGEGKLQRDLNLSVVPVSNKLLEVDLRLDSRVQSAMDGEEAFFPPYGVDLLEQILRPRIAQAFHEGAVPEPVFEYGVREAARRWDDVRKALRLFRQAGETAMERGLDEVTRECLDANIETTDKEAVTEKLLSVPFNHFLVLTGVTG